MLRPRAPWLLVLCLIAAFAPILQAAHIRGKVLRVGYAGSGRSVDTQGMDLFRPGFWTPILMELDNDDGDLFEGILQAKQIDRDGDQVVSTLPVSVRGTKNVFIYVPAGPTQTQQPFSLRITGPEGGPVAMFDDSNAPVTEWQPSAPSRTIPPSAQLLLDVSRTPLNELDELSHKGGDLVRELFVARTSAANLPDSYPGLQMVDIVLWDDPDFDQLRDVSQQQALLDWTQRGGTLVMGVARNWELVSKSPFGPLLPAPLRGTASSTQPAELAKAITTSEEFENPIVYCPMTRADLKNDAVSIVPNNPEKDETPVYAASRPFGRGRIVLVGCGIKDAVSRSDIYGRIFLRKILGLRKENNPKDEKTAYLSQNDAFRPVEQTTGFRVTSDLYLLAAFFFAVIYILLATAGVWSVLQRRKRIQYAWTAFALIAAIASGTSLAAVQVIRGIGYRVQQLCIVDARADSDSAVASCYFGLKTASHVTIDLALPRDPLHATETADNPGGLRPFSASPDDLTLSQYSAEARYQAGGPVGQLWNVPIRATLKQFEGAWAGHMTGQLNATLRRIATTDNVTLDSWIENRLDTDLADCYLFLTKTNVSDDTVDTMRYPSRDHKINVYRIDNLPRGQRFTWKDLSIRALRLDEKARLDKGEKKLADIDENNPMWNPHMLFERQTGKNGWLNEGYNIQTEDDLSPREVEQKTGSFEAAMMVLATFSEVDMFDLQSPSHNQELVRSRGTELDRSDALTTRTALLVGFANQHPGPVRLAWRPAGGTSKDWQTIDPAEARTVYRFLIPINAP